MKPVVLLTGATGFVGRQVLRSLLRKGVAVRVVCRDSAKLAQQVDLSKLEGVVYSPDLFLEQVAWWQDTCEGVDTVIHAAWYAEPGKYLQSSKNLNCLAGTLALAKGAAQAKVRRFVGVGTCFEYDLTPGLLSVQTPLKPLTPYANAKVASFRSLAHFLPEHQVEFAWCRLFYMYGEGEDARRLVPTLHNKLAAGEQVPLTSGQQIRDFMDVQKVGQALVSTALSTYQGAINICSGEAITVRQLAEQIADIYGRRDLLMFGVRPDNLIDPLMVVGSKSLHP